MGIATLEAKIRTVKGKACKNLRMQGLVPAVVYGREIEPISIQVLVKPFVKVITGDAGANVIINLVIGDNGDKRELPVITHGVDRDAITDAYMHIDFHHIIMTEKIKTRVPIEIIGGVPLGVKDDGGVLVHGLREIEVECLPANIPEKFEIDASQLKINESLRVSDLIVPAEVVFLHDNLEDMVATVSSPTKEEEIAPPVLPEGAVPITGEAGAVPAGGEANAAAAEGAKKEPAKGSAPAPAKEKKS